jgi:hypothetical protein
MHADRERRIQLRHRVQTLDSSRRLALVTATELKERLSQLGTIIRVQDLGEFAQLMHVADRLVALLQEGGAA